jgi:hypothetical protein
MPRGFKKDIQATKSARYEDDRSFVSLPKIIPNGCPNIVHHLVLYGLEDKKPIRAEIFRRNREENGGKNCCWKCGKVFFDGESESLMHPEHRGEWDHICNKPGRRCDCPENGRVACRACHKKEHVQVQFGRHE